MSSPTKLRELHHPSAPQLSYLWMRGWVTTDDRLLSLQCYLKASGPEVWGQSWVQSTSMANRKREKPVTVSSSILLPCLYNTQAQKPHTSLLLSGEQSGDTVGMAEHLFTFSWLRTVNGRTHSSSSCYLQGSLKQGPICTRSSENMSWVNDYVNSSL